MKKLLLMIVLVFAIGWLSNEVYSAMPVSAGSITEKGSSFTESLLSSGSPKEQNSPYDRITEDQIKVYNDRVIIYLTDPEWASFTDTNSMDPVIDIGANAIEIVPKSEDQIHVGDIVSYDSDYADGTIIHRVVEINHDSDGWYARMKGDNLENIDPGKIRFDQIERVLVGIIY